jgi:hypothetical protein
LLLVLVPVAVLLPTVVFQGMSINNAAVMHSIIQICHDQITTTSTDYPGLNVKNLRTLCHDNKMMSLKEYLAGSVVGLVIHVSSYKIEGANFSDRHWPVGVEMGQVAFV